VCGVGAVLLAPLLRLEAACTAADGLAKAVEGAFSRTRTLV
jgi:hypothetical protein